MNESNQNKFLSFLTTYWRLLLAALFVIIAPLSYFTGLSPIVSRILCIIAVIIAGFPLIGDVKKQITERRFDALWLFIVGIILGLCSVDMFIESAFAMLIFMALREWQTRAVENATAKIDRPAEICPEKAVRLIGDKAEPVTLAEIEVDDILLIGVNQYVPADGIITERQAELDMSALTGQTRTVLCGVDDFVPAGALARDSSFIMKVTAVPSESTAARLLTLSQIGGEKKAAIQKLTDRITRFLPIVIGILAILMILIPLLINPTGWGDWFYRAIVMFCFAGTYAIMLSTAFPLHLGHGLAAQKGAMIKGNDIMEKLARIDTVAVDKTGTLTSGHIEVTEVLTIEGVPEEMALSMAAILEQHSTNPAAQAIVALANERHVQGGNWSVRDIQDFPSVGVSAEINGNNVICGGERMMMDASVDLTQFPPSTTYLAVNGTAVAAFQTTTQLEDSASEAVTALRKQDIRRIAMVTGDHVDEAARVGKQIGISEIYSDLRKEDKLAQVRSLQSGGHTVAFIGDGEKDPDIMAAADVSVTMGLSSPVSVERADVVLTGNELTPFPIALRTARRTMRSVNMCLLISAIVKALVLILIFCGIMPLWLAVALDSAVALFVIYKSSSLVDAPILPENAPKPVPVQEDIDEFTP